MGKNTGLKVAAVGLVGWLLLRRAAPSGVNVTVQYINIVGINKVMVSLNVFNPSRGVTYIDSVSADILFNSQPIGNINYISKTIIQPLANTPLTDIPIYITPSGLILLASEIITKASPSGVIQVIGNVYVNGLAYPFNQVKKIW